MSRTVAIIQARMGSTRMHGKVMREIMGVPMLSLMVERLYYAERLDHIVVATTDRDQDQPIRQLTQDLALFSFPGSEQDVLDRYYQAACRFKAETIVRLTADCPLIDPALIDQVIALYQGGDYDYCSLSPRFPDGLDIEVFSFGALQAAWIEARLSSEREHVTPFIWKQPERFRLGMVECAEDLSAMRWTVDDERDLELVTEIFLGLYQEGEIFGMADILKFLRENPALLEINRGTLRNEGYLKSLKVEKMKKIPTLFQRNYETDRLVRDEVVPGCEWVLAGEGVPTRKWDGTCCMVRDGKLYKRYEVKQDRRLPLHFIPAQYPDEVTGDIPVWLPVGDGPEDRYHREAFKNLAFLDGTYELCGPKIQNNPERLAVHELIPHGLHGLPDTPRDFEGLRAYLKNCDIEGIVWHHLDGRMCKLKKRDFGFKR